MKDDKAVVANGLQLGVVADSEALHINKAQIFIRITSLQLNTKPAITLNHCYKPLFYFTSNRSKFITFVQAATKSFTNFSLASAPAYTSAKALNSEFEPKIKSALVAVHLI